MDTHDCVEGIPTRIRPCNCDTRSAFLEGVEDCELLDYVVFLEGELQASKDERQGLLEERQELMEECCRLKDKLETALHRVDDIVKSQLNVHRESIDVDRGREKCLEERVEKLQLELKLKDDLINHRRRRDEKTRRLLEKENDLLKKKATLGWMLGCLSEVHYESENEGGSSNGAPLLKIVRNIQRELERENVVLSYSNEPPHIQLEYVEKEIRRLIDCSKTTENSLTSSPNILQQPLLKIEGVPPQQPNEDHDKLFSNRSLSRGVQEIVDTSQNNTQSIINAFNGIAQEARECGKMIDTLNLSQDNQTIQGDLNNCSDIKKMLSRLVTSMDTLLQRQETTRSESVRSESVPSARSLPRKLPLAIPKKTRSPSPSPHSPKKTTSRSNSQNSRIKH